MIFDVITWNLDPEIFSIGNWGPRWYGLTQLGLFTSKNVKKSRKTHFFHIFQNRITLTING